MVFSSSDRHPKKQTRIASTATMFRNLIASVVCLCRKPGDFPFTQRIEGTVLESAIFL
jgi:hypothetical protein